MTIVADVQSWGQLTRMLIAAFALMLALAGCTKEQPAGRVTREAIVAARTDGANWLTTGRT